MPKYKRYTVNGVHYASLDEMPADARRMFEDADGDGIPDAFEHLPTQNVIRSEVIQKHYKVNGVEYDSFDDLPASVRRYLADRDGDGVPGLLPSSSRSTSSRHITSSSDDDPRRHARRIFIIGGVVLAVTIAFLAGWLLKP